MNKEELIGDFWSTAQATARGFGLDIGSECADDLRDFIRGGVNQLEYEGLLGNHARVAEAERHLIGFVGAMAHEARRQNVTMLHEFTFAAVRSSFCPLWPFC